MKKYPALILAVVLAGCAGGESAEQASEGTSYQESESATDESGRRAGMQADAESGVSETETGIESRMNAELERAMAIGLEIQNEKEGEGAEATPGKTAVVHYTGWLYDETRPDNKGEKFDSSRDRGRPYEFPLGAGRVIKGWDVGVAGMKVGGRRTLIIPSELGYGERGTPGGPIPGGATLVFDVELLDLK